MPWGASAAGQWYQEYGHKRLVPDMHLVYDEGSTKWLIKPLNPAIEPPGKKVNKPIYFQISNTVNETVDIASLFDSNPADKEPCRAPKTNGY